MKNKRTKLKQQILFGIAKKFDIKGQILSIKPYGNGLVNKTFLVETQTNKYILQQISKNMGDEQKLMTNIKNITDYIESKKMTTMKLVPTADGQSFERVGNQNFRLFEFFEGKVYETINSFEDFKKAGIAFAKFSKALEHFPANDLYITLPEFHNTQKRYEDFLEAVKCGNQARMKLAKEQIDFLIVNNFLIAEINTLIALGLPKRIIHGDTKINNIIFGKRHTCVIDFDTVMPSYLCYDFGDAIRSGCNSAKENQPETDVTFNILNYAAFAKGYLAIWNDISPVEQKSLLVAPLLVTYELCLRFLTDFLQDDKYFNTTYKNENLDRCKNQIALLCKMKQKYPLMKKIFFACMHNKPLFENKTLTQSQTPPQQNKE